MYVYLAMAEPPPVEAQGDQVAVVKQRAAREARSVVRTARAGCSAGRASSARGPDGSGRAPGALDAAPQSNLSHGWAFSTLRKPNVRKPMLEFRLRTDCLARSRLYGGL